MNEKLLFYLLGALLWYFLKNRVSEKDIPSPAKPVPLPGPVPAPVQTRKNGPESRKTLARPQMQRKYLSGKSRTSVQVPPGSMERITSDLPSTTSSVSHLKLHESSPTTNPDAESTFPASRAALIREELVNGRFDWQRAVVINELIQRKW